eukprot:COSAG02_NODE_48_length_45421_cov_103.222100_24_plen_83_part_00
MSSRSSLFPVLMVTLSDGDDDSGDDSGEETWCRCSSASQLGEEAGEPRVALNSGWLCVSVAACEQPLRAHARARPRRRVESY